MDTDAAIDRSRLWTCEMPCDQPVFDDPEWRFIWRVDLGVDTNTSEWTCTDPCDQPVFDDPEWRFIWRVDLGVDTNMTEWTCQDPCDQHLRIWGDTAAECIILRENSITSQVLFSYGDKIQ